MADPSLSNSQIPLTSLTLESPSPILAADGGHSINASEDNPSVDVDDTKEADKDDSVAIKIPVADTDTAYSGGNAAAMKYLELMNRLHSRWSDCPDIYVHYAKMSYILPVPLVEISTPSFLRAAFDAVTGTIANLTGLRHEKMVELAALSTCSGRLKPKTMTLILAPAGHGKSTFLKAIAGRLNRSPYLAGEITYNGSNSKQLNDKGIILPRLVTYIPQTDLHFPVLTVKETLSFAAENACAATQIFNDAELNAVQAERADRMIHLLGLEECADVIIGNDLLRGISGGQRKRVTIGEMLITNARVLCLDEISTGLDSSIAFHVLNAIREYCRSCHNTVVAALLQPTPEIYSLFDEIILLRDGEVVYHGPRRSVRGWFKDGLGCPIPDDEDEAQFIVEYLTDPQLLLEMQKKKEDRKARQLQRLMAKQNNSPIDQKQMEAINIPDATINSTATTSTTNNNSDSKTSPDSGSNEGEAEEDLSSLSVAKPSTIGPTGILPALTTEEMLLRYHHSTGYAELLADCELTRKVVASNPSSVLDPAKWSGYTYHEYAKAFPLTYFQHFLLGVIRQSKLFYRNKQVMVPRLFQAVFLGAIYGTLFYDLAISDYNSKMGLLLYLIIFGSFANLTELPVAAEARDVVTKQLDASFYPVLPYIFCVIFLSLPIMVVETVIFGSLMYWLPGLTPELGEFFFVLLLMFVSSLALSTFFRSISYSTPNPDIARQLDFPFILMFMIFAGFMIPYSEIPAWLIWIFWISPFAWAVRSLALNEFTSSRYDFIIDGENAGDFYLQQYGVETDETYKWAGIGYLLGFWLIFAFFSAFTLSHIRSVTTLGTKRLPVIDPTLKEMDKQQKSVNHDICPTSRISVPISIESKTRSQNKSNPSLYMGGLPFTPVTLAWKDIHFSIEAFKGQERYTKQLLNGIYGYSKPGTLTALMGASGSGKTTLMDVIAGRKTTGKISGEIFVNGRLKDDPSFFKLSAYVEQQDLHMGLHTVREALEFSAKLRLPATVGQEQRETWINEVMELLGLTRIAHRMIGDATTPGLSPGQMKLLTIAVELVANPSVLFLDEPTSKLDGVSAYRIMKAIKTIAETGRSVLCTIHQPSAELFFMFDRLLLLRAGGEEVYFADIGIHAHKLVDYFEDSSTCKNPPRLPLGQNPANWMLDVIGAGIQTEEAGQIATLDYEAADWLAIWKQSQLCQMALKEVEEASLAANTEDAVSIVLHQSYVGQLERYKQVQKRYFVMHWRNAPTNIGRFSLVLILGILLGIIYLQINKTTLQGIISFEAIIFLGISFPASIAGNSPFSSFFRQRAVYYRESTIGMYNFIIYSSGMAIVEIPYIFCAIVLFLLPYYFLVGFVNSAGLFFQFLLVVFVQALVLSSFSQLWMALCPSQISSTIVNGVSMGLFFVFGGLFIKASAMPIWWKWFYYIDPVPKAYIAAALPQFYCSSDDSNPNNCPTITINNQTSTIYSYVANQIEGAVSEYWPMIGWLILTMGIVRILNLLSLRFISHIKR